MHYKIVFILPVFEKPECVEDQVQNIHALCPNSCVLIHVNSNSDQQFYDKIKRITDHYDFCHMYPERLPTDWCSGFLAVAYIEMMDWCLKNMDADYIYFTASNSLVVNPLLEERIYEHDAYFYNPWVKYLGGWWEYISLDSDLFEYIAKYDNNVYVCVVEGAAFNRQSARIFVDELIDVLPRKQINYPAEEYWLPTGFMHVKDRIKFKDTCLERWSHVKDIYIDRWHLPVDSVREYVIELIVENQFEVLAKTYCYSLKRITRDYNDLYRKTIREHFGYANNLF